jgi:hypothetical protein
MASRSYKKMVEQYQRDYPHQVAVINGSEWRDRALSDQHYAVSGMPMALRRLPPCSAFALVCP